MRKSQNIASLANSRTTGSENARDGAHPYQVSLRHLGEHICGGSIVHEEWVITAAHCVNKKLAKNLKIVAGSNQLDSGGASYQVLEIYSHEDYNPITHVNDTAILKVEKIAFNKNVNKIDVETDYIFENEPLTSTGWLTNDLQYVRFISTNMQKCMELYTDLGWPVTVNNICVEPISGLGARPGHSGGPLVTEDGNGTPKLAGVTSWGTEGKIGPDVYARVSSYIPWYNEKCSNCLSNFKLSSE